MMDQDVKCPVDSELGNQRTVEPEVGVFMVWLGPRTGPNYISKSGSKRAGPDRAQATAHELS